MATPRSVLPSATVRAFDFGIERPALRDAQVAYHPSFLDLADADRLFAQVEETTPWRQEFIEMYGKSVPIPRLSAWHGEHGRTYTYSKIEMEPQPWTPALQEIRLRIEETTGLTFNSMLANLYRDGSDHVAWHADDEPELGPEPVIASVSLGACRKFSMRHNERGDQKYSIDLAHGSLLMMQGLTQSYWQHCLAKTARAIGPRINLTFRTIL